MDPATIAMLGSLSGLLGGGGGGTKVSQSASNSSQSVVSFTSNNNLGGGELTGNGAPVTTPITNSANSSNGADTGYGNNIPAYDLGVGSSSSDVAASVSTPIDTSIWLWVVGAIAAVLIGVISMRKGKRK